MTMESGSAKPRRKKRIKSPLKLPLAESAQCYWALANSYSAAAEQLLANPSSKLIVPILYLLGHSLELHFKAFLVLHGIEEKQLAQEFGHDLVASLRECKKHGFCNSILLTYNQVRQIVRVNHYYQGKQLEYFFATAKCFGAVNGLQDIVSQVSKAMFNPITNDTFRALASKET